MWCNPLVRKMKLEKPYIVVFSWVTRVMSVALCCIMLLAACSGGKTEVVEGYENVDTLPSMYTCDVNTLISDSGITRYRIEAPLWYMYEGENTEEPYWYFPQGIYVEQFDTLFVTETMIEGDTAIYYKKPQKWRLTGNVHIENTEGKKFYTQQLYWDQKAREIYSDSAIRIIDGEEVIEGVGFKSNEQITKYVILRTTGIFTVKREPDQPDTTTVDTE